MKADSWNPEKINFFKNGHNEFGPQPTNEFGGGQCFLKQNYNKFSICCFVTVNGNRLKNNRSRTVAILHDVVESGKITIGELEDNGFDSKICKAVDLLSRNKGQKYFNYIDDIKTNKLAKTVKLADLTDNYLRRKQYRTVSKTDRQKIKKYKKAYKILTGNSLRSTVEHI